MWADLSEKFKLVKQIKSLVILIYLNKNRGFVYDNLELVR